MKTYQHPLDYQHIKAYGTIQGWGRDFIHGQQKLAYLLNAPFDTIEVTAGNPALFRDLPRELKQQFGSV